MDYFADLDISMDETHVCVVDREGVVAGLPAAMRGLIAARTAVMTAVAAIDSDIRQMTRASAACSRLMTIAASPSSCMRCYAMGRSSSSPKPCKSLDRRPNPAPKRSDARGREQATAWIV
jgi:hypothetical protein